MASGPVPLEVGGYVLAGGQSSRMGRDKALLPLGGKPLVQHAVIKLGRVCREVAILSARPELAAYRRLVPDLHPGCGPLGGIEAALIDSRFEWNLICPVDVPFVPTALLRMWAAATVRHGQRLGTRLSLFTVCGRPQPALLMAHRDLQPFVEEAVRRGRFKLLPVLEEAAEQLVQSQPPSGNFRFGRTLWAQEAAFESEQGESAGASWEVLTEAQRRARPMWFSNLNTPEDFAAAAQQADALDT